MHPVCLVCAGAAAPGARYCGDCGSRLRARCVACDAWLDAGLAFCPACGHAVSESAPPTIDLERRMVSVLFADVVGFTALTERLDAEDVRRLQSAFFTRVREVSEQFDAIVEKYVGDAVMMVFGAPRSRPHDGLRAIRAALRLREVLAPERPDTEAPGDRVQGFTLRIGIATGEAIVDLGALRTRTRLLVTGDVVTTAARLQEIAPSGNVLVDEATAAPAEGYVRFGAASRQRLAGRQQPVVARMVAELRAAGPGPDLRAGVFVGRRRERAVIERLIDDVSRTRRARMLRLISPPGLGKSRLLAELEQRYAAAAGGPRWRIGRCQVGDRSIGLSPLADIVRQEARLTGDVSVEEARAALRVCLERLVPAQDVDVIAAGLGALIGVPHQGLSRQAQLSTWRRFLVAMAEQQPTVVVVDDAQLAADPVLEVLTSVVEGSSALPLTVVFAARPELSGPVILSPIVQQSAALELLPLETAETRELLVALTQGRALPEPELDRLVGLTEGVPLFAEEYVALLEQAGDQHPAEQGIPENLRELVGSRLDLLEVGHRRLLAAAAVLGGGFAADALAAVGQIPVEEVLERLAQLRERRFLRLAMATDTGPPAQQEHRFRHRLHGSVIYSRLPRERLVQLHDRAADWRAGQGSRSVATPGQIAAHRTAALRAAELDHQDAGVLRIKALTALGAATEHAVSMGALAGAVDHAQLAVTIAEDVGGEVLLSCRARLLDMQFHADSGGFFAAGGPAQLASAASDLEALGTIVAAARAWTLLGEVSWFSARRDPAKRHLEHAVRLLESTQTPELAVALVQLARLEMLAAEHTAARGHANRARELAVQLDLPEVQADAMVTAASSQYALSDPDGIAALERSVAFCREQNAAAVRRGLNNLASALYDEGDLQQAARYVDAGIRVGRTVGIAMTSAASMAAERAYDTGDWNGLVAATDEFLATPVRGDEPWDLPLVALNCWIRMLRGEQPIADAETMEQSARATGFSQIQRSVLSHAANCRWLSGDSTGAIAVLDELQESWRPAQEHVASRAWLPTAANLTSLTGPDRSVLMHRWLTGLPRQTPWVQAARCAVRAGMVIGGDRSAIRRRASWYARAAGIYDAIGDRSDAMLHRYTAAHALLMVDDQRAAWPYVEPALSFARRNKAAMISTTFDQLLGRQEPPLLRSVSGAGSESASSPDSMA